MQELLHSFVNVQKRSITIFDKMKTCKSASDIRSEQKDSEMKMHA